MKEMVPTYQSDQRSKMPPPRKKSGKREYRKREEQANISKEEINDMLLDYVSDKEKPTQGKRKKKEAKDKSSQASKQTFKQTQASHRRIFKSILKFPYALLIKHFSKYVKGDKDYKDKARMELINCLKTVVCEYSKPENIQGLEDELLEATKSSRCPPSFVPDLVVNSQAENTSNNIAEDTNQSSNLARSAKRGKYKITIVSKAAEEYKKSVLFKFLVDYLFELNLLLENVEKPAVQEFLVQVRKSADK